MICRVWGDEITGKRDILRYYVPGYNTLSEKLVTKPVLLSNVDPSVGLSNPKVTITGSDLICEYTRQKSIPSVPDYMDLSSTLTSFCFLFAEGKINETTGI